MLLQAYMSIRQTFLASSLNTSSSFRLALSSCCSCSMATCSRHDSHAAQTLVGSVLRGWCLGEDAWSRPVLNPKTGLQHQHTFVFSRSRPRSSRSASLCLSNAYISSNMRMATTVSKMTLQDCFCLFVLALTNNSFSVLLVDI